MPERRLKEEKFTGQSNTKIIWRIMKLTKPHWRLLVGFLIFIILISLSDSIRPYLLKIIIDEGILARNQSVLVVNLIYYGILVLTFGGLLYGLIRCSITMGELMQYDLRKMLFNHLQSLSFSYFDKTPVGWIMSRINSDTPRIAELTTWMLIDITWAVSHIIFAVAFMLIINWKLALIVSASIPVIITIALRFKKYIITEYRKVRAINSRITGAYNENITGVRIVKALVRERKNLMSFGVLTGRMYRASFRAAWLSAIFMPIVQLISSFAIGAVVWYGGYQVKSGSLTIGDINAFFKYIWFMLWPIMDLSRVYAELQHSIAGAERVFSLLDSKPDIRNSPDCLDMGKIRGKIDFKNVTFYYKKKNPVLRNFSFSVRPSDTIALVGPTGGGKTTIANLVCRFYEPKSGEILIDGIDYTKCSLESLQSQLGVVLQTPHLFSGTIRENIRYGKLDATDDEVYKASKLAHAHDFIKTLKKGYDEEVGEGGVLLSVGQRQLISIARAILVKPGIIIMDEATSSIDTLTESLIQKGMSTLLKNCTSFIIAHRLSTIRNADRILVIDEGKIKESGTHRELLALEGHYYQIYTSQFRMQRERDLF